MRRQRQREMFVPLRHDPGHAQVDFGEALAVIAGDARKIHFFAMDLPHSDGCVVQACPSDSSEARQRADLIDFMRESPHARLIGGGGGIRTHGDLSTTPVFKTGAFNRSATPPMPRLYYGFAHHHPQPSTQMSSRDFITPVQSSATTSERAVERPGRIHDRDGRNNRGHYVVRIQPGQP